MRQKQSHIQGTDEKREADHFILEVRVELELSSHIIVLSDDAVCEISFDAPHETHCVPSFSAGDA